MSNELITCYNNDFSAGFRDQRPAASIEQNTENAKVTGTTASKAAIEAARAREHGEGFAEA